MSDFNFKWIADNFEEDNFVFFDIGCAYLEVSPTTYMMKHFPNAKYYSFEAANCWNDIAQECDNKEIAERLGIKYQHVAVSDVDGEVLIYPSISEDGQPHPWSNSIFTLNDPTSKKIYSEPYSVKSIRLETFCKNENVTPDFIHIDVEGAELMVFKGMGEYKPKVIWAETCAIYHYATGITYEEFDSYMDGIGYYIEYRHNDTLYIQKGLQFSPYETN